jgi:hypothetical protein
MPFEALDVDISIPENRDAFLESYAFFKRHDSVYADIYDEPGMFDPWIKEFPEEAADFLRFCSEHDAPEIRHFAGILADDFFETNPDLALEVIEARMQDHDLVVSKSITGYVFDILRDSGQDLLQTLGMLRTAKLVRSYKEAIRYQEQFSSKN